MTTLTFLGAARTVTGSKYLVEHDGHVGVLLDRLDEMGIAEDTIVIYTTDNGAETFSWPDGGTTPFRGEKNTNWEGGWRVPSMVRWPGKIEPGSRSISARITSRVSWARAAVVPE